MPALLCLGLAGFLAVTTEMLPVGLLPAISAAVGVHESDAGQLVTVYAVMVAVFSVPLTLGTKRCARRPLILITIVGYLASNVIIALAPHFGVIVAGRLVGGLAHSLFFSVCIGYVPRIVAHGLIGRGLAVVGAGTTAGFVLGVPLSTTLGSLLGWRNAFWVLAAIAVVVLALVLRHLPAVAGSPGGRRRHGDGAHSQLVSVVASNTLTFVGQYTVYTYISVVLLAAGAHTRWIGPLLLLCGICGLAGLVVVGRFIDRRQRMTVLSVLAALALAILAVGAADTRLVVTVLAAAVWCGLFGGVPAMFQTSAVRVFASAPEVAGAWINASANIGIALGALIGGGLIGSSSATWHLAVVGAGFVTLALCVAAIGVREVSPVAAVARKAPQT